MLYIAGVGRSGSTLLERVLGGIPGFVNAGEVNALFSRVAAQDQRCGCGRTFSTCSFWTEVGRRGFGGWPEVTARMAALQPRLIRQRQVPRLVSGVFSPTFRRELADYLDVHEQLYRTIADVAGAEVVVDASKSTAQLFALRRVAGLDLRVVNLVRDSRGVANSWSKAGLVKSASPTGEMMGTYAPHRLAGLWATLQAECSFLRATVPHSARVRYEDLVLRPRQTLERVLDEVGLEVGAAGLDHVGERSVDLTPSHGVAGSRTRFTAGRIELELDEAWRSGLSERSRLVVTALTLPQLVSYGYVGRRAPAARREVAS